MGLGGGGESAHHLHPPRFTPESRHSLSCVCCNCQPSSCLIGTTIEHTIATTGLLIVVTYLSRQRWQWTHFQCLSRQGFSTIYVFCTDWQDAIRTVKLVVCATKQRKEIITAVLNGSILQPAIKCKLWCFFFKWARKMQGFQLPEFTSASLRFHPKCIRGIQKYHVSNMKCLTLTKGFCVYS